MSVNYDAQQHDMECVRIEPNSNRDWEFEFLCPECGYEVVLPLFEILARGDINLSHADGKDEHPQLLITLQRNGSELPQCFKDFLNFLDKD